VQRERVRTGRGQGRGVGNLAMLADSVGGRQGKSGLRGHAGADEAERRNCCPSGGRSGSENNRRRGRSRRARHDLADGSRCSGSSPGGGYSERACSCAGDGGGRAGSCSDADGGLAGGMPRVSGVTGGTRDAEERE
jgi:hypothetical protein